MEEEYEDYQDDDGTEATEPHSYTHTELSVNLKRNVKNLKHVLKNQAARK